jgi:uncharacterized protein YhfF
MSKSVDDSVHGMWADWLESIGETPEITDLHYSSWYFADNEKDANELVELVLAGVKRGTAGSGWEYEHQAEPLPAVGELHIVTDFQGLARCLIRTTRVEVLPYRDVPASFAEVEGEGDQSLAHWRSLHWPYFERVHAAFGRSATQDMPVVCHYFEQLFPEPA